jgi:hypothetical protein
MTYRRFAVSRVLGCEYGGYVLRNVKPCSLVEIQEHAASVFKVEDFFTLKIKAVVKCETFEIFC